MIGGQTKTNRGQMSLFSKERGHGKRGRSARYGWDFELHVHFLHFKGIRVFKNVGAA